MFRNRKKTLRIILGIALLMCIGLVHAQSGEEILKKATLYYSKNESFSYKSQYKLYESYTAKSARETYDGLIVKSKDKLYLRVKDVEMVSFSDMGIKVNPLNKTIFLSKEAQHHLNPLNISQYLKDFNVVIKENKPAYYVCELSSKSPISMYMIEKIIFHIDKKDYHITKQILYTVNDINVADSNGKMKKIRPRIEIAFTPENLEKNKEEMLFRKENYIEDKSGKLTVSSRYKGYTLIKS